MATLSIPIKPPSRSFLEAAESSMLLDWELDSLMTEKEETVARTLFNYRNLKADLKNQCDQLSSQQEDLDESRSQETATVLVMGSWGALDSLDVQREESRDYAQQICDLMKQILSLKIRVLCLKIVRVSGIMKQLQEYRCMAKWNLFVLLLHKVKRATKERRLSASSVTTKHSFASVLDVHPGKDTESDLLHQFVEEVRITDAPSKHEATLDKLLQISAKNQSFEAFKLKAYIRECWEVKHINDDFPTGVHPDRYQEFVGGMCQYIVDKQFFGAVSYDFVFAKLEHHLMPAIYTCVQRHIIKADDDAKLARRSNNLSFLSQSQFGIKDECKDSSLAPYFAAISALKTCSLSLTPSRKIFQIVKAAKLVFEILNEIAVRDHRCPPGADEFMDVWVYVVLKANIPNFASTIAYLKVYSNPNLAF
ncbi:hypothetical protein QZH41_009136 [Actinostola sp. cb2023]|nr:hypothetical protein QZH41_009136 [Actinostola sp. cb2023]